MQSLRCLARTVPRTALRSSRYASPRFVSALTTLRPTPLTQQLGKSAFSSYTARRQEREGAVDSELSTKLESELQNEREATASTELPPHLQEYLASSPFELKDSPGVEEVTLTRTFGNENIRVSFTIADLALLDADPESFENDEALSDPALYDEDADAAAAGQSGGAQSKSATAKGRTADGNTAVENDATGSSAAEGEEPEPSFPAHVNIMVQKKGSPGAMSIEAVARDGNIVIENVYYFKDAAQADVQTAEQEWNRRSVYSGPPFGNLDEDLQVLFERYIEERGIDTGLALWIPDYIDYKEQREYVSWLDNVRTFVDS